MKRTIASLLMTAGDVTAVAGANGFYRTLTLDQPASDLTDFPVLFSGTYTYLKTIANGGKVNNSNGYDIVFYSDVTLTTKLKFERVFWDATTGTVEFWVKIPTLTSASATVIYLAYGNTSISTDQQDAANTWNSSYQGVWHLPDGTTLTANDSKGVNNGTLVNTPTAVGGKIDGGANLASASSQYITMGNVIDFTTGDFTIEFWYKTSSGGWAISKAASNSGAYVVYFSSFTNVTFYLQTNDSNWQQIIGTNNTADGQWHHVVAVRSSTNVITLYVDGSLDTGTLQSGGTSPGTVTNSGSLTFSSLTSLYNGSLDEVRITNDAKTANYVSTVYSNQNDPANFYIIGSETPA